MGCVRCGACCRTFGLTFKLGEGFRENKRKGATLQYVIVSDENWEDGFMEHLRARGLDTKKMLVELPIKDIPIDAETVHLTFNYRCRHLTEDNLCAIYENRPKYCREFFCRFAQGDFSEFLKPDAVDVHIRVMTSVSKKGGEI